MRPLLLPRPASHPRRQSIFAGVSSCRTYANPRAVALLLSVLSWTALALPVWAQYPGELTGRVTDAITGAPVENAFIEVIGTGLTAYSDGRGEFGIRGLEPGRHTVRVTRMGYEPQEREIEARNGAATRVTFSLGLQPVGVEEIRVDAGPTLDMARDVVTREEIEASGELTAADLLEGRAGVVIQRRGPAAPQTVSIRGSSADEVLVLLDGAPLNDPITGAADLSTIPASQIESMTLLRGSQSAIYGPGAAAGAVLITSRTSAAALGLSAETGSLGYWSGTAETSGAAFGLDLSAGGEARRADGSFVYQRPTELGGGSATRLNADISEASGFAAAAGVLAGGDLRLRAGFAQLDRGIPGPSFLPTPAAREELERWRGQASWERRVGRARLSTHAYAVQQKTRFVDLAPPNGLPYDSRTDALAVGGRLSTEVELSGLLRSLWSGLELRDQVYKSDALDDSGPGGRLDLGIFAGGRLAPDRFSSTSLTGALRADRDDLSEAWYLTHELSLTAEVGPTTVHVRHASSYSPPSFGDQFFREGLAVEPNPDLRAERIPNEVNLGASIAGDIGGFATGALSVQGYLADVKDMIVWAPDFRFVWSPRNFDVKRRGLDVQGQLQLPARDVELNATYSLARATYDRAGNDDVQVIYRPRHSGSFGVAWRPSRWEFHADARFVGTRYPVPAPVNALDPYWTLDLRLRRAFDAGGWQIVPTLSIDRLLNNDAALIYGYPEPGRLVRLEIAARPN
ncbi:MAG TPA: TonB-dependent receptor [Gemmatimonadota bacterium]|nr:TonB-dependent receptor [Gemmatimonadota bacterium]